MSQQNPVENLQFMIYMNSLLLLIVGALFLGLLWYFRKDVKETKDVLTATTALANSNQANLNQAFTEIQHNREDTQKILRIIAKHTGANIGI